MTLSQICCTRCDPSITFPNPEALQKHKLDSDNHLLCDQFPSDIDPSYCDPCEEDYATWQELAAHRLSDHDERGCQECRLFFCIESDSLEEHYDQKHPDYIYCPKFHECGTQLFASQQELAEHNEAKHDERCRRCISASRRGLPDMETRAFNSAAQQARARGCSIQKILAKTKLPWELEFHECDRDMDEFYCEECEESFKSKDERFEHDVEEHSYCLACEDFFDDDVERGNHYTKKHGERYCAKRDCEEIFDTAELLAKHRKEAHKEWDCDDCKRLRNNPQGYRQHRQSSKHVFENRFCGCGKGHVSESALILHLESGKCPNGMDLRQLNEIILKQDTSKMFIKVSSLDGINPPSTTIDQKILHAHKQDGWVCWMCRKKCSSKEGLVSHLQSSAHQKAGMYGCPGCKKELRSFSGVVGHIDTKQCKVHKYDKVMSKLWILSMELKRWGVKEDDSESDSD